METKGLKVKSPCVGETSIKEIVYFATIIFVLVFNCALIYYQIKDLPEKVIKNSDEIITLKTNYSGLTKTVDGIDKKTDTILEHILNKK
jgi:hypothetical protein